MKNALLENPSIVTAEAVGPCPVTKSRDSFRSIFVGNLYRVDGKMYAMNHEEQVFDVETGDQVADSDIQNQVFDLNREDIRIASDIRTKAKMLSKGDSAMEEMHRLHLALSGLSQAPSPAQESEAF